MREAPCRSRFCYQLGKKLGSLRLSDDHLNSDHVDENKSSGYSEDFLLSSFHVSI